MQMPKVRLPRREKAQCLLSPCPLLHLAMEEREMVALCFGGCGLMIFVVPWRKKSGLDGVSPYHAAFACEVAGEGLVWEAKAG